MNNFNKLSINLLNNGLQNFNKCKAGIFGSFSKRNTYILKRRYPVGLIKQGVQETKLKGRHYVYDLIENTEIAKHPMVEVVLKQNVEGVGVKGQLISVKRNIAYNDLLLTNMAEYATPEAIEKAKALESEGLFSSSEFAVKTVDYLRHQILSIVMNKDVEWILEPWHVKASFRKAGVIVPEKCIKLPSKQIKGPDLNLESKAFFVKVTINNHEKVDVRCVIHHWSTNLSERLPYVKYPWCQKHEPIFEEDREKLNNMPSIPFKYNEEEL